MNKKKYFKNVYVYEFLKNKDKRGFFVELLNNKNFYNVFKINFKCLQTSLAYSRKNVFRGFHFQRIKPIEQIITVVKGKVDYYFFDIRKKSDTFGKYKKICLSDKNKKILYLPKGFAGGYHCLDNENLVLYHHNEFFNKKFDSGFNLLGDGISLKFSNKTIRSRKDKKLISFKDFKSLILK